MLEFFAKINKSNEGSFGVRVSDTKKKKSMQFASIYR